VLVPRSGVQVAREVLMDADLLPSAGTGGDSASRVMVGLLAALVLVALIAWIGTELLV
jgi:MYXO-CTERM domain-containing protein